MNVTCTQQCPEAFGVTLLLYFIKTMLCYSITCWCYYEECFVSSKGNAPLQLNSLEGVQPTTHLPLSDLTLPHCITR